MTILIEDTSGKIRSRPIAPRLRRILIAAGELTGVDTVRVTSGGQMSLADAKARGATKLPNSEKWALPNGKIVRTGSTRHDDGNAADLMLEVGRRTQDFGTDAGRRIFETFVRYCASLGCTGFGAGPTYMQTRTVHVGFGTPAVWYRTGKLPLEWLVRAVAEGQSRPLNLDIVSPRPNVDIFVPGRYRVVARRGLHLRGGPGGEFPSLQLLDFGTELQVIGSDRGWAMIDLQFDGTPDGFVHGAYIERQ